MFVADLMRHNAQRAKEFLYHLRSLQQAHPNVRWLFTGSIGLDAVVARRGNIAGALVDLHNFPLGGSKPRRGSIADPAPLRYTAGHAPVRPDG